MPISIVVDLINRSFTVNHGESAQSFAIPEGYDIRVSDLKEIMGSATSWTKAKRDQWWLFQHDRSLERDEFTTSRFRLVDARETQLSSCYVEWTCNAEGYDEAHGYRGDGDRDWLGGAITDQPLDGLSYDLAYVEERAEEDGYTLTGPWLIRVLDDETGALVQARRPASWKKPPRWRAIPVN